MKNIFFDKVIFIIFALLSFKIYSQNLDYKKFNKNHKPGAFLVKIADGRDIEAIPYYEQDNKGQNLLKFSSRRSEGCFKNKNLRKFERAFPDIEKYDHPNTKILSRYYIIEGDFDKDKVMLEIIKNYSDLYSAVEPISEPQTLHTPNDYFNTDWQRNPPQLVQIRAEEAWDITTGSNQIQIAITDPKGFFFDHPDYVNSDGTNQMIYIDGSASDLNFTQSHSHGLTVASAAGMATNNNTGISAIGYNSTLMAFGSGVQNMLGASYDHDAEIVVASWYNRCTYSESDQLIMDMIHDNGTVIIVAAGNGNAGGSCPSNDGEDNGLTYPASYDHVISVGGVTTDDEYFDFGNGNSRHLTFNEAVDLTAAGWGLLLTQAIVNREQQQFLDYGYGFSNGTSFAAPTVAGLAALVLAIKPDLKPDAVEQILKLTAEDISGLSGNSVYAGLDGAGRIDAYEAVALTDDCFNCNDYTDFPQTFYHPIAGPIELPLPPVAEECKINVNESEVTSGNTVTFSANRGIVLNPGFHAHHGSTFTAKITDVCSDIFDPVPSNARTAGSNNIQHLSYTDILLENEQEILTSNEELYAENENFVIYPNPSNGKFKLVYQFFQETEVEIKIFSTMGKLVFTNYLDKTTRINLDVDLHHLRKGIYLVNLSTENGVEASKKIRIE